MKVSIHISIMALAVVPVVLLGTVADLESLQAGNSTVVCQYTFEGGAMAERMAQKAFGLAPAMAQVALEGQRMVAFLTPGLDGSTRCAVFSAFASGAKGAALSSVSPIVLAKEGAIEFLVRPGKVVNDNTMIAGTSSGDNGRWRFLSYDGAVACVSLGDGTPHALFGAGTVVPYVEGDWYYVVITWVVADGCVTLNAWVSNLSSKTPKLARTIADAVNAFDGNGQTRIFLGSLDGTREFADGSLDAIAIYDSVLSEATATAHHIHILNE